MSYGELKNYPAPHIACLSKDTRGRRARANAALLLALRVQSQAHEALSLTWICSVELGHFIE